MMMQRVSGTAGMLFVLFVVWCMVSACGVPSLPAGESTDAGSTTSVPLTFDPDVPGYRLYDPCTELPPEAFTKIRFGQKINSAMPVPEGTFRCSFSYRADGNSGVLMLGSDSLPFSYVKKFLIAEHVSAMYYDMYTHTFTVGDSDECVAAIATSRGRIWLNYSGDMYKNQQQLCQVAVSLLEKIYPYIGG